MAGPVGMPARKPVVQDEKELQDELIPGIPNEVTLAQRNDAAAMEGHTHSTECKSYVEPSNSKPRSARARLRTAETLVVVKLRRFIKRIALYSMRNNTFHFLPSIPQIDTGIPDECQCVSLEGRIYVLGGFHPSGYNDSANVYMLDLVGPRKRENCASRGRPRLGFGCHILDGKLFVFGGKARPGGACTNESEVYDPKRNAWSTVMPKISHSSWLQVTVVGRELVLYGAPDLFPTQNADLVDRIPSEVYNPVRNEWRMVRSIKRMDVNSPTERWFVANENTYVLTINAIHLYDTAKEILKPVLSISCIG